MTPRALLRDGALRSPEEILARKQENTRARETREREPRPVAAVESRRSGRRAEIVERRGAGESQILIWKPDSDEPTPVV